MILRIDLFLNLDLTTGIGLRVITLTKEVKFMNFVKYLNWSMCQVKKPGYMTTSLQYLFSKTQTLTKM